MKAVWGLSFYIYLYLSLYLRAPTSTDLEPGVLSRGERCQSTLPNHSVSAALFARLDMHY